MPYPQNHPATEGGFKSILCCILNFKKIKRCPFVTQCKFEYLILTKETHSNIIYTIRKTHHRAVLATATIVMVAPDRPQKHNTVLSIPTKKDTTGNHQKHITAITTMVAPDTP